MGRRHPRFGRRKSLDVRTIELYTVYSMPLTASFNRPNLSENVAEKLREMIVDGRLKPDRINEVHLAAQLGVSRTPLREALMRLEAEGAVICEPRRGFKVRSLSAGEVEQIYLIRAILDPEALKIAGLPSPKRLRELSELNNRMMDATDPKTAINLDDKWHLELLEGCPNIVLLELIKQFILRTRRYELALMRVKRNMTSSIRDHTEIISLLETKNLAGACKALKNNMVNGKEPIIRWLRDREK